MPELIKLRRRARLLGVFCLLLCGVAAYGWLRPPRMSSPTGTSSEMLEGFNERVSKAGHTQRVRMLRRLVRSGGKRAVAAVIEMLRGARSDRLRLVALEQLGRLGGAEAVAELAAVAESGSLATRRGAIDALGTSGSRRAVDHLLELLGTAGKLRAEVIGALGKASGSVATAELARLANDTNESERAQAIRALGQTGRKEAFAALDRLTRDSDTATRRRAIDALGMLGSLAAKTRLIALARRGTQTDRRRAVSALGNYNDMEVQLLLSSLVRDPDAKIAAAALGALGSSDAPLAREALVGALANPRPELRLSAARTLARSGQPEGREALVALVNSQRGYAAARELADLKDPQARQALLSLARSGSLRAQNHVLSALGRIAGPDVERTLQSLMHNASPAVAGRALRELARRRGKKARPMLKRALAEGSLSVRRSALAALVELKDPRMRDELIAMASSTQDYTQRYTAIQGLVSLGDARSKAALLKMFKEGPSQLQSSISYSLAKLGGATVRDTLFSQLKKGRSNHYAISYALGRMRDPETKRRLREMLDDPTVKDAIKTQLVGVLSRHKDGDALLAAASHSDKTVRNAALLQLGRVGGPSAERALIDAAAGGDASSRRAALSGLAQLGTPRAVEAMSHALDRDKSFYSAVRGLAKNGSKIAIAALSNRYRSATDSQRATIVNTLGYSAPGPAARRMLLEAVDDRSDKVAATAARVLARVGGGSVLDRLVALMQSSPSQAVRYAVASQLRYSGRPVYKRNKRLIDTIFSNKGG